MEAIDYGVSVESTAEIEDEIRTLMKRLTETDPNAAYRLEVLFTRFRMEQPTVRPQLRQIRQ